MSDIQKIKSVAATKVSSNIGTISSNNNISKIEDYKTTNTDVEELSLDEEPSLFDDITQVFKSTGATIATFEASLAEGVGKLGESLVDFTALAGTAIISPIDFVIGKILGEEGGYGEVTKDLWDATKSFVSTDHVGNAFDSLYENTEIGNWVKENSYGFDTVRSIGTNVGEIAGIIALSIATCGAAGVISGGAIGASTAVGSVSLSTAVSASLATMKGVSTSTVKAWNEGASTFKGMAYGGAHGIWEGTQWIIGGKIGELGKVGARVALDGVNGAIDSIVQPTMQKIYSDKTFKELWDENGGVKSLIINTGTALGFSALSEVSNLRKSFTREKNMDSFTNDIDNEMILNMQEMEEVKELTSLASAKGLSLSDLGSQSNITDLITEESVETAKVLAVDIAETAKILEPKITEDMKSLEITGKRELTGLSHKLKGIDSLQRKILSDSLDDQITIEKAAQKIGDSVRYTMLCDEETFTTDITECIRNLIEKGYQIKKFKNTFGNDIYKGVNVSIKAPTGILMELQFHTNQSFTTKEEMNHVFYEIFRNKFTTEEEKELAKKIMQQTTEKIRIPEGILDYKLTESLSESFSNISELMPNIYVQEHR